jgi:hypothetical protein
MAKYAHIDLLDGGIDVLKNSCTKMILLSAYSANYTTVTTTNNLAQVTMATGDFAKTGADGAARVLTITTSGKSTAATQSATGTPDLHIAFCDGTRVLYVTDETSNQAITSGNTVNFPSTNLTYTTNQPT